MLFVFALVIALAGVVAPAAATSLQCNSANGCCYSYEYPRPHPNSGHALLTGYKTDTNKGVRSNYVLYTSTLANGLFSNARPTFNASVGVVQAPKTYD